MLAHSSLDRVLGYGLKYPDSFSHTHLGRIGRTSGTAHDQDRAGRGTAASAEGPTVGCLTFLAPRLWRAHSVGFGRRQIVQTSAFKPVNTTEDMHKVAMFCPTSKSGQRKPIQYSMKTSQTTALRMEKASLQVTPDPDSDIASPFHLPRCSKLVTESPVAIAEKNQRQPEHHNQPKPVVAIKFSFEFFSADLFHGARLWNVVQAL